MAILPILLFRGTTSILAMIITPIIIGAWFYRTDRHYVMSVILGYLLLVAMMATTQIVFAMMYLLQGWVLYYLFYHTSNIRYSHRILYAFVSLLFILMGMSLTQLFIQIPLMSIMINLGGGYVGFGLIVIIQASIVSLAHVSFVNQLKKHGFDLIK